MLLSHASFAQNVCVLRPIEPETWSSSAQSWMLEMQQWIETHCHRFPLHELLPDHEQRTVDGNALASSPFDAAFRFQFNPPPFNQHRKRDDDEVDIPAEFALAGLHPHRSPQVVLGLLHCPSCPDMQSACEKFFKQVKLDFSSTGGTTIKHVKVFAFQCSPLQLEQSSACNLPALGVEIFPVNSTQIAQDSPVCFYAQFLFKELAKQVCMDQLEVVKQSEAVFEAAKKLGGSVTTSSLFGGSYASSSTSSTSKDAAAAAAAVGVSTPADVSFKSSSLDHFPTSSFQELIASITANSANQPPTYPGDTLRVSFGNYSSPASRKDHQKLCARLQVWIGKHLLLAGMAKPSVYWLEMACQACNKEQDSVWESTAWETLHASRMMLQGEQEYCHNKDFKASLLALGKPTPQQQPASANAVLFVFQSLRLAYAKRGELAWADDVYALVREARRWLTTAAGADASLYQAYFAQERVLWRVLGKPRLRLLAEMEMLRGVEQHTSKQHLAAAYDAVLRKKSLTPYERKLVLERAVLGGDTIPLRFAFPLLHAWTAEPPSKLAELAERMLGGGGKGGAVVMPQGMACPFVCGLACVGQPDVTWEAGEAAAVDAPTAAPAASVFVFDPFAKQQQMKDKPPSSDGGGAVVWCVGEDNYIELQLVNALPLAVSVSYQLSSSSSPSPPAVAVVVELHAKEERAVRLGPFRSELARDTQLAVSMLGAKFLLDLPRPPRSMEILPLLVRCADDNGDDHHGSSGRITNVSKSIAYLNNSRLGPGEHIDGLLPSALKYFSKPEQPRFARRLQPAVPTVSSARITACDLREHIQHGTATACTLQLQLPPASFGRFTVCAKGKGEEEEEVLYSTRDAQVREVRVPLPGNCTFGELKLCCETSTGARHSGCVLSSSAVQYASTAPPKWILLHDQKKKQAPLVVSAPTATGASLDSVPVMGFCRVDVEWDMGNGGDQQPRVWLELDVYQDGGGGSLLLQPCKSVAWAGVNSWEATYNNNGEGQEEEKPSSHSAWVSFLEQGEYYIVFSATSLLRTKWWLGAQRVCVV